MKMQKFDFWLYRISCTFNKHITTPISILKNKVFLVQKMHLIVKILGRGYLKMLPVSHAACYCSNWLEGPPHPLNPCINKHSKYVHPVLKLRESHAGRGSNMIQLRLQATLRAEWAHCVSPRAQRSASQLLTSSEQQLLGDYSTPVTEHTGEHAQSLPPPFV